MSPSRILSVLAPLLLLYLVVDLASAATSWSAWDVAVTVAAFFVTWFPHLLQLPYPGNSRRLSLLGFSFGLVLLAEIGAAESPAVFGGAAVGFVLAGIVVADLAWSVPRPLLSLRRGATLRIALTALGGAAVLGSFANVEIGPGVRFAPNVLADVGTVEPAWPTLAAGFFLLALLVALVLRGAGRIVGRHPEALAADSWATFSLVLAIPAAITWVALRLGVMGEGSPAMAQLLGLITTGFLMAGHSAMRDIRTRDHAGPGVRLFTAALLTGLIAAAVGGWIGETWSEQPGSTPLFLLSVAVLSLLVFYVLRPALDGMLAPASGRLLRATSRAAGELSRAGSLKELAATLLPRLREASGDLQAEPFLFLVDPEQEARIDQAGVAHLRGSGMPEPLASHFLENPAQVLVRWELERSVVRKPAVRPLAEAMALLDAEVMVPVMHDGELEGAFMLPRGRRGRRSLTLEELNALHHLARGLGGPLALLSSRLRALERTKQAEDKERALRERVEVLEEQLARTQADADALKARGVHRSSPPVAYAAPMREVLAQAHRWAPLPTPVLLVAEAGTDLEPLLHELHDHSGRDLGSYVVCECGSLEQGDAARVLFGDAAPAGQRGWLRLAAGGTLVLHDVPALPLSVQRDLAEALATHEAQPVDAAARYPVDVRVLATATVPVSLLEERGSFDPELGRWFQDTTLSVPPLRDRREDLESLLWSTVDHACRIMGRDVLGVAEEARQRLASHLWPGNERELQWVISRAVAHAEGSRVEVDDLPALTLGDNGKASHPLDGSFQQVEKRLLLRALERAQGNKSEAARLVGLKRSTFLDKLRRQGISEPPQAQESA